jgi:hypothetical protein
MAYTHSLSAQQHSKEIQRHADLPAVRTARLVAGGRVEAEKHLCPPVDLTL